MAEETRRMPSAAAWLCAHSIRVAPASAELRLGYLARKTQQVVFSFFPLLMLWFQQCDILAPLPVDGEDLAWGGGGG